MKIGNIKVEDAKRPIELTITARDVQLGNTKDPGSCAAARACVRQLHAQKARVQLARTYVLIDGKYLRFATPPSMRTEIVAFDRGGRFAPGVHMLMPPNTTATTQARKARKKQPAKASWKRKRYITAGIRARGILGGGER